MDLEQVLGAATPGSCPKFRVLARADDTTF